MNEGGSVLSLTYIASEKVIPGYGGGMSSAKAQLESDTRVLAYEAGRKYKIRVNTISAGPLKSRAASAIGGGEKGKKVRIFLPPSLPPSLPLLILFVCFLLLSFSRPSWRVSDTRVLAFEVGRKCEIHAKTISPPLPPSLLPSPQTFIEYAIDYSRANAPLEQDLFADDVGATGLFLSSPMARCVTGVVMYVDNGLHAMGMALDSVAMQQK